MQPWRRRRRERCGIGPQRQRWTATPLTCAPPGALPCCAEHALYLNIFERRRKGVHQDEKMDNHRNLKEVITLFSHLS